MLAVNVHFDKTGKNRLVHIRRSASKYTTTAALQAIFVYSAWMGTSRANISCNRNPYPPMSNCYIQAYRIPVSSQYGKVGCGYSKGYG